MKRLLFTAILAASATACVEGNNPVQILDAIPKDPGTCDRGDVALLRGSLNYSVNTHYYTTFSIYSPLNTESETAPSAFIGQEFVYNYTSRNPSVSFSEESLPVYFVVEAGAQPDESWVSVDLIGNEARKKLDAAVPSAPDAMTLLVSFKIRGKLSSGKEVETNEVTYPIEISRGASCAEGQTAQPLPDAPCGYPGQDGNGFTCI